MKQDGGEAVSRVLESKLNPPFNRSQGFSEMRLQVCHVLTVL